MGTFEFPGMPLDVCKDCKVEIENGVTLSDLIERYTTYGKPSPGSRWQRLTWWLHI